MRVAFPSSGCHNLFTKGPLFLFEEILFWVFQMGLRGKTLGATSDKAYYGGAVVPWSAICLPGHHYHTAGEAVLSA